MSSSNHILSQEQQFKSYLEGKLSEKECIDFVKELENNPFYKDAFEGYKENPGSLDSLPKLQVNSQQFFVSNFTTNFYTLFILISFVFGSIFIFNLNNSTFILLKDISELPEVKKEAEEGQLIAPKPILELSDENIDESVLKEEEEQVQYESVVQSHSTQVIDSIIAPITENLKEDLIKVVQKPLEEIKEEENKELEIESVPLISLHGLTSVNYSKIESKFLFRKTTVILTGLPANIEESGIGVKEPSHELRTEYISYEKYLGDIQYYFKRNKFKKALKGYKEILKQHPTDINAHFYSALCYYNINQSAKALEHLDVILIHQYDTFRQEGEWYKAQVLYDLKRKEEAISQLDKIIKRNDFYATQANEFRLQINK